MANLVCTPTHVITLDMCMLHIALLHVMLIGTLSSYIKRPLIVQIIYKRTWRRSKSQQRK